MPEPGWELFSHSADIGIRGSGPTLSDAFEQAALALTAVITEEEVGETASRQISCGSEDPEILFLEWINEIVYLMSAQKLIFGRYEVEIRDGELFATAFGEYVDVARHKPAVEVKGATFTELEVSGNDRDGWTAQCVVDV